MRVSESRTICLALALLLAVCQVVPAGLSFAGQLEPTGNGVIRTSGNLVAASLASDDTFTAEVEGVELVFQVIDADAHTVRLGTGEGRGNGLADGVYPADHKVVVPESVDHEGVSYAVKEIARSALRVPGEGSAGADALYRGNDYVSEVVIRADLDYIGVRAFSCGQAFSYRLEDAGRIGKVSISAFSYCSMGELVFPEGCDVEVGAYADEFSDNIRGGISSMVYPVSYSGTIYCDVSALKSLYVKSPYSRIDPGDESYLSVSISSQAKYNNDGKKIPYFAWSGTQAADAIMNGYRTKDNMYFRAMAALSDWTCPASAVPAGQEAYVCKRNVELGIEDGAVYPFAPTPSAKCVDDDGGWTLTLGDDYTVEYFDEDGAPLASAPTRPGAYGVRFTGNDKSAWGSSGVISYTIGADLSDAEVAYDEDSTSFAYTGSPQSPAVTVTHGGSKLTNGLQYMERYVDASGNTSATAPTLPGRYVKRIASRTPWAGLKVEIPFEIRAVEIASAEAANVALSGGSATPQVTTFDAEGNVIASGAYSAAYSRGGSAVTGALTQAGAYSARVSGDGAGCTGEAECAFNVVAADRALASAEQVGELVYTDAPLEPAFAVKDADGVEVPGSGYSVAYADADGNAVDELVDAGEYTATATAVVGGDYAGSVTCPVTVTARAVAAPDVQVAVNRSSYDYIKSLDWAKLDGYDQGVQPRTKARVYLSAPVEPAAGDFDVTLGGVKLEAGRDFDVTLDDRVRSDEDDEDHETAFTVTLKGNYSGTVNSADLEGTPKVKINKRIAHTAWYKGVLFSYAVDADGEAVITGLGVDLTTSTQASDLAAAYQSSAWGQKITVPDTISDGDATFRVKEVCPNAFDVPRDGGNGSIASIAVFNGATELEVEAGIESVEAEAFPCGSIERLTLHEGLKRIEPYAFSGASAKCKEIVIPASVERIGYAAFGQNMDSSALERFEFAEGSRFCGWSEKGIEMATDDMSNGVVRLTGSVRRGTNIVDGGYGSLTIPSNSTKSCAPVASLSIPAQFTSLEYVYWDFKNCQDVYVMADSFTGSAPSNGVANNLGEDATVWGWDNEGTPLIDVVDANSSLKRFRPFAVLGDGYEYEHATGGPKTYPANVAVGSPNVTTTGEETVVDWGFQLGFANSKYRWTPVEGEDFTVAYVGPDGVERGSLDGADAGVYEATLTGNGVTCFGTATAQVVLGTELPADAAIAFADGTPSAFVYDGAEKRPAVESVTLPGAFAPLDPESEYSVRYEGNVDAGTMRVVVEGRGGYYGSLVREFPIERAEVAPPTPVEGLAFTGEAQEGVASSPDAGYAVSGDTSAVNAGSYRATAKLDSNHVWAGGSTDDVSVIWSIARAPVDAPRAIDGLVYTGKAQEGVAFKADSGYAVSGDTSAVNAGSYQATVKLDGNHAWTGGSTDDLALSWSIARARVDVPKAVTGLTYTGSPQVGVSSASPFCSLSGNSAASAGSHSAKAALKDKANCTWADGTTADKAVPWSIAPASLSSVTPALAKASSPYTGKQQAGSVSSVTWNGKALSASDYTVSAKAGKAVGSYSVTVTGRGNFTGTSKAATFKVVKAANSAKAKWTSKTYKLKAAKKTGRLAKAAKVALPAVTKKFGAAKWKVTAKDKKKVLSLSGGKVKVKKGAKAGTYTIKLAAKVAATKNYKSASTKTVTVKVRIK